MPQVDPLASVPCLGPDSLTQEFLGEAATRLRIAMLICGGVYFLHLLLYLGPFHEASFPFALWTSGVSVVVSFALASYIRRFPCSRGFIEGVSIGYELFLALCIALSVFWKIDDFGFTRPVPLITWGCAVIILFPFLVPMPVSKALKGSLAAAAMTPLGMFVAYRFAGVEPLPNDVAASLIVPPFLCAFAAIAPSKLLNRLGDSVMSARKLGSYELVEKLGQGGMGEVWRARHRLLARPAAVKLIRPELLGVRDPAAIKVLRERFEREAQTTANLQSPHTVELFDFGVAEDGSLYFVMELLSGINLQELVERFGPLPPGRVIHLLEQAADSLEEAHRACLVHRDIKPANLQIGHRGRHLDFLRVLDFGLVKLRGGECGTDTVPLADSADFQLTADGSLQGTPAFLSPEAVAGAPIGPQADIYQLGCVAYWLLTGHLVFEKKTPMAVAIAHATELPSPPSKLSESPIPASLEAVVMACLAKDPADRPQSADALLNALRACDDVPPWTPDLADRWWRKHLPASAARNHSSG